MKLYLVTIISIALLIIFGDQTVRMLAGVLLALGALPLWGIMRRFFQRQFWRDVGAIIAASDERPTKGPPSAQE
jgi:hypothetical protein